MDALLLGKLLFMIFALLCGLLLFVAFGVFMRQSETQTAAERLEEYHNNASFAEQQERIQVLMKAGCYPAESPEYNYYMDCHEQLKAIHQARWNERVNEITNLTCRISESEQDELDRGADWREAVEK